MRWQDLNKDKSDSEKYLDDYLVSAIKEMRGLCLKLVAVSWFGFPDRTILLQGGRIYFIELKSKGKTPKPRQKYVHKILRSLGFRVDWIDNLEDLKRYIDDISRST
jgi:hypothetical protein